jgi:hypothetical protein
MQIRIPSIPIVIINIYPIYFNIFNNILKSLFLRILVLFIFLACLFIVYYNNLDAKNDNVFFIFFFILKIKKNVYKTK